ncbi:UNVERIFIED_ORG: iron complex outermembrane receptor protein [Xanthomonas axonopodis]
MTRPTLSVIGLAIAAVLSANAQAQQADAGATTLDTVIVTGTRASDRTVLESTVPVDVLTAEDIRKAGVVNGELGSALQALLPSFNFPRQSNSGGADHIRAAQLRGLSPDQVLVLVNGKRRHTSALVNTDSKIGKGTTPVDFNSIPINAIKRIEVLRDGAGAQYGSDAIAGVINVILDDNPERGELEASFGAYNTDVKPIDRRVTDGQTSYASAKVGSLLGDDGGFFKVGLELKNREATNRAGFDQIPSFEEQTPANLALRGQRNYVLGDGATKGLNAWLNTKVPFSASGEFYAFGTYNQRDTEGANYFRYPDSSANWREIYPNGYRPISEGENRDLQLVAGARGQWGNWDYDASVNYGRNDFTYRLRNSLNASLGPGQPHTLQDRRFRLRADRGQPRPDPRVRRRRRHPYLRHRRRVPPRAIPHPRRRPRQLRGRPVHRSSHRLAGRRRAHPAGRSRPVAQRGQRLRQRLQPVRRQVLHRPGRPLRALPGFRQPMDRQAGRTLRVRTGLCAAWCHLQQRARAFAQPDRV